MAKALVDMTSQGKPRKWGVKKAQSRLYAKRLYTLADSGLVSKTTAGRVWSCGDSLLFAENPDGSKVLLGSMFCHDRFCALCQWRRMLKMSYQLTKTIEKSLLDYPSSRFLFLTLTVKNCKGDELRDVVTQLNKAVLGLVRRKAVARDLLGYVKALEVTVNDDKETYHPHVHILLQVKSSYFKQGHYLSQEKWRELWQKAMKLDYDPSIRVSIVKARGNKDSMQASVSELAKYQTKSIQYLSLEEDRDLKVISTLRSQLKNTRMISYSGHLKKVNHELFKTEDEKTEDLVNVDGSLKNVDAEAKEIVARWNSNFKTYVIDETNENVRFGNGGY